MCIRQGAVDADSKSGRFAETLLLFAKPVALLFRRNTLLRPADFFDSLSLRISRCEGFFSCFYQLLEHLAAFLEVFEDAVAGGGG